MPGLLETINPSIAENPFYKGLDSRRNAIAGLALGGLSGDTQRGRMANALAGAMQGREADTAYQMQMDQQQEAQDKLSETVQYLQNANPELAGMVERGILDPGEAVTRALSGQGGGDALKAVGGHLYNQETGEWISPPQTDNKQNVSLTPQWAQDETGQWHMVQTSSTGELVRSEIPDGLTLADPRMLNAEKSAGRQFGKDVAGAQFSMPRAELTRDQTLKAIQDIRAESRGMDEQFGRFLGVPQQMTPAIPSTEKAKFQVAVDRATNRAFLEAREMLKGGGQITDFESRKAEAAITSMQTAMERGDKEQFLKAVEDFEQAVKDGFDKLGQQAGMLPGIARQPVIAPSGQTSSGVSWSIE